MLAIQRKDKNQKGFTLAELLVVVAIIAVLVAVSIPIFTSKLEKARETTDIANMRAAKAAATVALLDDNYDTAEYTTSDSGATYVGYYNTETGKFVASKPATFGKGTAKDAKMTYTNYDSKTAYTDQVIRATITTKTETVVIDWTK